jgi:hypothetical protein
MSRTIHSSLRTLTAAGLLGVAGLVAPGASHAQAISSPRALLNFTASLPTDRSEPSPTWTRSFADPESVPAPVHAERALLGRTSAGETQVVDPSWTEPAPKSEVSRVDGERALLVRRNTFRAGR